MKLGRVQALAIVCALAVLARAAPETMSVQVRTGQVRASPSFVASVLAELPYGTQVEVVETSSSWLQVKLPDGRSGWMHQSALTRERLQLRAGTTDVASGARVNEVALATKGFTHQVETAYRQQRPDLNFAWVDKMESFRVSAAEIQAFLHGGMPTVQGGRHP